MVFKTRQIVDIHPWGEKLSAQRTQSLGHFEQLELIRLVVRAGERLPPHRTACVVTLQCLEGEALLHADSGSPLRLNAGQLVCLGKGETHAVEGIRDASLLLTIVGEVKPQSGERAALDAVDEASVESFPASDPTSHTPITRSGP